MSKAKSPEGNGVEASDRPPLALIAGPTASGKSDMAFDLAFALELSGRSAVVINADSAQVYSGLPILSAWPDEHAFNMFPHKLYGAWDAAIACSAADWATRAKGEIEKAHAAGKVPIIVGGTGLYIRTLLDGIAPVPSIDPVVRSQVRQMAVSDAYAALMQEDPARAVSLAPADATRIARALEVVRSTGKTLGEWQRVREGGIAERVSLHPLILLPERAALYERCNRRFSIMLRHGAIEEVRDLLARDLDPRLPAMRAIGVPEITGYLGSQLSLEEAEARGAQSTRNYAKRQYTWLRHQPPQEWRRYDPTLDRQPDGTRNYDPRELFEILFQH